MNCKNKNLYSFLFYFKFILACERIFIKMCSIESIYMLQDWKIDHLQACPCIFQSGNFIYEPVTKGRDLKWDTLPQNQTPSKLFSVLPLESGMFQVTISIIKKWFWSKCVLYGIKTGVRSGVDICNNGHSECHNKTEKNHLYAILMLLVHLSSC